MLFACAIRDFERFWLNGLDFDGKVSFWAFSVFLAAFRKKSVFGCFLILLIQIKYNIFL